MGFWSTLATVAGDVGGSFIGDPMLGNQVMSVVGAFTGGGDAAAKTGQGAAQTAASQAVQSAQTGNTALEQSGANEGAAGDAYRTALNGSQEQLTSLLGPEINTVMSQYDNAAKTASTFGPRGGGRTATMAELPFAKAGAAGNLLSNARAGAAAGAANVGAEQGSKGVSLTGQATGQLAAGLAPGMQQSDQTFKAGQGLGQSGGAANSQGKGIGNILAGLFSKKNNGSGSNEGSFGGQVNSGDFSTTTFGDD